MRAWSLNELWSLTRGELFALHRSIAAELARLPAPCPERLVALTNLRKIRQVLARPGPTPW